MIRLIVVPLDGSSLAEASLAYAAAVQRAFASKLLLIRVVGGSSEPAVGVEWRLARAEAHAYLEKVTAQLGEDGIEAEAMVAVGRVSEAILEVARERRADLIVLSSHGRGGASRFGVGGTAHKIVSSGAFSILLVRVGEGRRPDAREGLKRILVPLDGSARSDWALCLAASLARSSSSELVLLKALPRPDDEELPPPERTEMARLLDLSRRAARDRLTEWARQLEAPGFKVRGEVVVTSSIARAIDASARTEGASLVVLSAHGATRDSEWPYGSVVGAVLQHGCCPVLVFQDAPRGTVGSRSEATRRRRPYSDTAWKT